MSNSLNKIHYAVEIELLNLGQDNPGIGMEGGTIRYISDGIDASTCTYKDTGLAVTETYYSDIVDEDGFGDMGSSINIEASGDFAYLQEFELALANIVPATGNTYAQELDAEETYALGGIVTGYVIKDNVFVQRYSGVTVDTVINTETETFTWVCEDASLNDNTIINNKAYGKIKQTIIPL